MKEPLTICRCSDVAFESCERVPVKVVVVANTDDYLSIIQSLYLEKELSDSYHLATEAIASTDTCQVGRFPMEIYRQDNLKHTYIIAWDL